MTALEITVIDLECLTCHTHDEAPDLRSATAWGEKHRCLGRPYPLRIQTTPPGTPSPPATFTPGSSASAAPVPSTASRSASGGAAATSSASTTLPSHAGAVAMALRPAPAKSRSGERPRPFLHPATRRMFEDFEWLAAAGMPLADIASELDVDAVVVRGLYEQHARAMPDVLTAVTP